MLPAVPLMLIKFSRRPIEFYLRRDEVVDPQIAALRDRPSNRYQC